ncbi:hypothetical protein VOM14_30465 [Paraburkholderia sp. MPAMCS5]|uniref:hypothetical protein n=1 Tax=Paraburkholderia sp. MPAMCS5 TaxID=3112563 RepID=UPI002E187C60|nr:hypothetical protein [Paraburkholderia sp. MPAMCS5]
MLRLLGHQATFRPPVLELLAKVFPESINACDLPAREAEALVSMRAACQSIATSTEDFAPVFFGRDFPDADDEARLRNLLALAEYEQDDASVVTLLDALCKLCHHKGAVERLADLATALRDRASRRADVEHEIAGANYLGIALEYAGRNSDAMEAYEHTLGELERQGETDSVGVHMLRSNLARIVGQSDDQTERAIGLFEAARAGQRRFGDWDNYLTSTVNQARLLCQAQRNEEAVALLSAQLELTDRSNMKDARARLVALMEAIRTADPVQDTGLRKRERGPSSWSEQMKSHQPKEGAMETAPQMATRAMAAYENGQRDEALHLNQTARDMYRQANDKTGESRCWNNLAEIHASEGTWDEAASAARHAFQLREAARDVEGQIMTLSNLMEFELRGNHAEEAYRTGERCLALAGARTRSWEVAKARVLLIKAALNTDRLAEVEKMLPYALEALNGVDHPARAQMLQELEEIGQVLGEVHAAAAHEEPRVSPPAVEAIEKARQQTGEAAKQTLLAALAKATNPIDQATLHGEAGNALAKTDPAASQRHYEQSGALYEAAGQSGMAWFARLVVERLRVEHGADPDTLLAFADPCPIATVKLDALTAYASVLLRHYQKTGNYSDDAVHAVSQRIEEALELRETTPEVLGRTALQLTSLYTMTDDLAAARRTVERARVWLVRSNSPYLSALEQMDKQLREEGA